MATSWWLYAVGAAAAVWLIPKVHARLKLSRAKHPSLAGHAKMSRRLAALLPFYGYDEPRFFAGDGAPAEIAAQRRTGFAALARTLHDRAPRGAALTAELAHSLSDVAFTNAYRVPFQYRDYVQRHLQLGAIVTATADTRVRDLDGNWSYDLTGSYGVNLFGYDFYKECIDAGAARVRDLGPVLGPYHPLIADVAARLKTISDHDEVSFHMSGTEAVMQAVRLACFHTRRQRVVVFCGSYHGWWDGVQPGPGNRRRVNDVYTLRELSPRTLDVLRTRRDIACVLVNPLQGLHPNASAPSDGTLLDGSRVAHFDRAAYTRWLRDLRDVCTARGIVLIFDEVFVGFRLARGGAQEYFGVRADLVTYGKTLGGGLPVGVLCGRRSLMKRFRDDRPTDLCLARGTFNSHPYVIGAMHEFLQRLDTPAIAATYADIDALWDGRAADLNTRLAAADLPVRVANLASIWTIVYTTPSRYHWLFQYYLRAAGLALSWVGTGRLILSHNFTPTDFAAVADRFIEAARAMQRDGWWWIAPGTTHKSIRRTVLRELIAARFGRAARAPTAAPPATAGPLNPPA